MSYQFLFSRTFLLQIYLIASPFAFTGLFKRPAFLHRYKIGRKSQKLFLHLKRQIGIQIYTLRHLVKGLGVTNSRFGERKLYRGKVLFENFAVSDYWKLEFSFCYRGSVTEAWFGRKGMNFVYGFAVHIFRLFLRALCFYFKASTF